MGKVPEQGAGRGRSASSGPDCFTPQQRALYLDLRETYERLYVLAGDGRYDQLAEEVRRTDVLFHDLRREACPAGPDRTLMSDASNPVAGARGDSFDDEELLTQVLDMRERALGALGAAVADTQSVLARLDHSRRALGQYRIPRSTEPRLQSCRA